MKRLLLQALLACVTATACFGGATAASIARPPTTAPARTSVSGGPSPSGLIIDTVATNPCTAAADQGCVVLVHHYSLHCGLPATGSMPNPTAACAALADLLRRMRTGTGYGGCAGVLVPGNKFPKSTATISGVFHGAAVHLTLQSDYTWCGKSRPALRDLWTLSTFPCNTPILHSAAPSTGCPPTPPPPAAPPLISP